MKLSRVESHDGHGLRLIFDDCGAERAWPLDSTSALELLALLMKGRMRRGNQVLLPHALISLVREQDEPTSSELCLALDPLNICAPLDRSDLRALRADIDHALLASPR